MNTDSTSLLSTEFGPRLIPLCDGRPGLRASLLMEVRAPEPQFLATPGQEDTGLAAPKRSDGGSLDTPPSTPVLDFIASSEALDRYDEIIAASGWRLDNYRRNPVFQNAHQYGDIIFTLGKALITEVRQDRLFQRIQFATDVNPMARIAYGLYKGKFLNAVSVGFIPLRWLGADGTEHGVGRGVRSAPPGSLSSSGGEGQGEEASSRPSAPTLQRSNAPTSFRRKYLEQELLEVSAVAIPANPDALALALKSGAIEKTDLRDLAELLRGTLGTPLSSSTRPTSPTSPTSGLLFQPLSSTPAGAPADTSALGLGANEAQLLKLARALRELLRRT